MKPTGRNITDLTKLFRREGRSKYGQFPEATSDAPPEPSPRSSGKQKKITPKRTSVVSLRLTSNERQHLEALAKGQPLSTFIRSKLLGDDTTPRKPVRSANRAVCDEVAV